MSYLKSISVTSELSVSVVTNMQSTVFIVTIEPFNSERFRSFTAQNGRWWVLVLIREQMN